MTWLHRHPAGAQAPSHTQHAVVFPYPFLRLEVSARRSIGEVAELPEALAEAGTNSDDDGLIEGLLRHVGVHNRFLLDPWN